MNMAKALGKPMALRRAAGMALVAACALLAGCARGPQLLAPQQQTVLDRAIVEYPAGFELRPMIRNLNAPSAIVFDAEGSLLIAESGLDGREPHIFGYKRDGQMFQIYPPKRMALDFLKNGFRIYGPVGGMAVDHGRIYVSHRDEQDRGGITAFGYDGRHTTIVADLPAEGDYGVTDLAIHPDGRLYFGVGAATNSGVVGLDNWAKGWVHNHPRFCDIPQVPLKLLGYRFDSSNPRAGLFNGNDLAVTAPFQPFGVSNQTWIAKSGNDKPTAAIYSVSLSGGDLRVEAHGIRYPRGLAFNEYGRLYMTNNGMELRGTRPVKDDPDSLLRFVRGTWYGWPDFSADLLPISDARFQPPPEMILKTGYPDLAFVVDQQTSGLLKPDRATLLQSSFPALSGAAKMDFVPGSGPFKEFRGNVIVALSGDMAPFATSGRKLTVPVGYKVMRVDVDSRQAKDFVFNTQRLPASMMDQDLMALERPADVKFGPDGSLYILDMGRVRVKNGKIHVQEGSGKIFRLAPLRLKGE